MRFLFCLASCAFIFGSVQSFNNVYGLHGIRDSASAKIRTVCSSGPQGLKAQATVDRRDIVLGALATLAFPSAAFAVKARTGLANVLTGDYQDPNHPDCKRSIKVVGSSLGVDGKRSRLPTAVVSGTDNKAGGACVGGADEIAWKLTGKINDSGDVLIDFSPKGGPKDLLGKWDTDGILFPDGNKWSKIVQ